MPSRQTLDLLQSQTSQKRPCNDSRYKMSGSVVAVLEHTKLTAAEVGPAVATYLDLLANDSYLVGLRARGNLAGGAGARTLSILAAGGQLHSDNVCRTDAPYFAKAAAVVAAREEVERVSGGKVLEACTVYFFAKDCCDEATRQRILGAFQLLARCGFAFLNRFERQYQDALNRLDFDRLLELMVRETVVSRQKVMPGAYPKGGPAQPLLVVSMASAALVGETSLPVIFAWVAEATQEEICRRDARRFLDSQFHQGLLASTACHFWVALPTDEDELAVARAQYGASKTLRAATEEYWGFEGDGGAGIGVYYSQPMTCITNIPERIATQLLSDAHTKGPHRLLDLNSPANVKLIGDAYNEGSPCGTVEVAHFLQDRASYTTVDVTV